MRWFFRSLAFASIIAAIIPAWAGQTAWTEVAPDTRIRLITSDQLVEGKSLAAFEIDMPHATKTYWRIPGETGIPILLDTSRSKNVVSAEMLWPYPERSTTAGYLDFVYHGPTILPLELTLNAQTARLEAGLILGVCDEICVPVRASFAIDLNFDKSDLAQTFRINQAMANVPVSWSESGRPITALSIDETARWITVEYAPGTLDPNSLIIDTGNPTDLFSLPQKSPESGIVRFELLDPDGNEDLKGAPMTVTFVTTDGVFELTKTVIPGASENETPQ